jgi:hypothetical protein
VTRHHARHAEAKSVVGRAAGVGQVGQEGGHGRADVPAIAAGRNGRIGRPFL